MVIRKSGVFMTLVVLAVAVVVGTTPTNAKEQSGQSKETEALRQQLATFFTNVKESSPTSLGDLARMPEVLEGVQARIAGMSQAELEELQTAFAQTPDWQAAPEALSAALTPEAREQLRSTGKLYAARASEAETFRHDVGSAVSFAKLLPPETRKRLAVDPAALAAVEKTFAQMTPLQLAAAQQRLAGKASSANFMRSLPQALQRGTRALSEHGPLTDADRGDLDRFRLELETLLADVQQLPPQYRAKVHVGALVEAVRKLESSAPEMTFMVREQIDPRELANAQHSVALVRRFAALGEAGRQELEGLRGEMLQQVDAVGAPAANGAPLALLTDRLASLAPEQVMVVRDALATAPAWRETLPAVLAVIGSPEIAAQMAAAGQAGAGSPQVVRLETFRQQALAFVEASAGAEGVDPKAVAVAKSILSAASPSQLVLMRGVWESLPPGTDAKTFLSIPSVAGTIGHLSIDCVVSLGSIDFGDVIGEIDLGSINFNFLCNPIESVINTVVDAFNDVIDGIVGVVTQTYDFLVGVPDLVVQGLRSLLDLILDADLGNGLTIRRLIEDPAAVQELLNLAGDFWQSIPELPQVPCPPDGTDLGPLGEVGDGETATRFSRYKFISDKIIDIIPDTEISLAAKIPAQILYAGLEYLGVCLDAAAADRDALAETAFRNGVNGSLATSLTNELAIQAAIAQLAAQGQNQSATLSDQIEALQTLELRLKAEFALQSAIGADIALFQLPSPFGYLELVRDIVRESIDNILAAEGSNSHVAQAEVLFTSGLAAMNGGHFKAAFKYFKSAYREAVR